MVLIFTFYVWLDGRNYRLRRRKRAPKPVRVVVRQRSASHTSAPEQSHPPSPQQPHPSQVAYRCTHNQCTSRQSSFRRNSLLVERNSQIGSMLVGEFPVTSSTQNDDITPEQVGSRMPHSSAENSRAPSFRRQEPIVIPVRRPSQLSSLRADGMAADTGYTAVLSLQVDPGHSQSASQSAHSPAHTFIEHNTSEESSPMHRATCTPNQVGSNQVRGVDSVTRQTMHFPTQPANRRSFQRSGHAVAAKVASLPVGLTSPTDAGASNYVSLSRRRSSHCQKPSTVSDKLRQLGFDHIPSLEQVCATNGVDGADVSSPDSYDQPADADFHIADPVFTVTTFSGRENGHLPTAPMAAHETGRRPTENAVTVV